MLIIYDLKTNKYSEIEGNSEDQFLQIKYDTDNRCLEIASDYFGTALPIYFGTENDKLYISDSLIGLKHVLKQKFQLNVDMLPYFFYNGFLPGKHTLIKGVYKLPPKKKIVVKNSSITIDEYLPEFSDLCYDNYSLEKIYDEVMTDSLIESIPSSNIYNVALSSGFDSNFLLYLLRKLKPDVNICCYSVGGSVGVDETDIAAIISNQYNNTSFNKAIVTPDTLNHLDDIVYRLEGSVYERGIFLQYELAKMLHENGCKHIICGECADQVFHIKTYEPVSDKTFLFGYSDTPYEMASYVVLKKSALMLNSFGIKGVYPYLNNSVVKLGYMSRKENGNSKEFHKLQCKRLLPESIYNNLQKIGGSTELLPLMDENINYEELCKKCKYYNPDFRYTQKYSKKEAVMDYYLTLQYIESFERQFCDV